MTFAPEQIAKSGSEHSHQAAVFAWAALSMQTYPELKWMFAIPNGGSRGDNARSRAIRGAQLKAEGVKSGVADIMLPVKRGDWSGLFIEMKKPSEKPKRETSKGGLSEEQIAFADFVKQQNFGWMVCYSWEEAVKIITSYLDWK